MKNLVTVLGVIAGCALAAGLARAEPASPPAPSAEPVGAAGAADQGAAEQYLPGPGGGDVFDPNGPTPLESTGLEDGSGGGCKCSVGLGSRTNASSSALGLATLALGLLARRGATARARQHS